MTLMTLDRKPVRQAKRKTVEYQNTVAWCSVVGLSMIATKVIGWL